ncbi:MULTISPECIES: DUF4291 domain-containing protein [unclassified Amycolatopsis]|uniref:DUF4291 domain-containing protein n=1 Tax=unclassified Amycolatopsis TaxID=2618356 RepID=UPI001C6A7E9A|nr:DUF4291 domain-containing protein [Amycolatopsis sp. DSM 110486]QYN22755.1 DUF4291 domain-containing protein [Amycolatopsis sp. DSM 110486]
MFEETVFEEARVPAHQIRARHDDRTIRVYQAYSPEIADAALAAGTFVAPFKRERMTWIKPSFTWMGYRCGWATKPGQERALALDLTREGFAWVLAHAALSHFDPRVHRDEAAWKAAMRTSPVRVQWDPERDVHHRPLPHRSIQLGLSGEAVDRYVGEWITAVTDVTPVMRAIREHLANGRVTEARALLPAEPPYPLSAELAEAVDATKENATEEN